MPRTSTQNSSSMQARDAGTPAAADGGAATPPVQTQTGQVTAAAGTAAPRPPSGVGGSMASKCPDNRQPQAEACNGLDDDCDGRSDETFMLRSDPMNCGACGKRCERGDTCCDGSCTNTTTNADHCGACGMPCPSGEQCRAAACRPMMMVSGRDASPSAGRGGTAGAGGSSCVPACAEGETCCGGACVDLQSDVRHCSACNAACGGMQPGCCDGECVDLLSETTCGSCDRNCSLLGNGSITCSCVRDASGEIGCAGPVLNLCL